MRFLKRILHRNFFIRLRSWEYWPFFVLQFPLVMYWLWLSLRARSLLFFSASNPSILLGGMLGESKYDILRKMPVGLIPKTIFLKLPCNTDQILQTLREHNLNLPVIFKPDIGERGFMVKRIFTRQDIEQYLQQIKIDFLAQELIDLPVECSVFYTRFPDQPDGKVTSIAFKEMLSVTGDGKSTLQELILNKERAKLQLVRLREMHNHVFGSILPAGTAYELNSIGNHCLGTKFLNGKSAINEEVSRTFDKISKALGEFYFGRYDLKCASLKDLDRGNVKILEVNGCGAEPSHIYQPGFSIWKAYKVLFAHWKNLYAISRQNKLRGYNYPSLREGIGAYKRFISAMR